MSNVLPSFDPTTGSGTFDSTLYNLSGALVIHNLGIFDIQFTYPDSTQFIVDANSVRCKHLAGGFSAPIAWRTVTTPNTNNPYTATVIIEAYKAGTDEIPPEFIVPLTRQANVGGIVTSVSQVIQDGQPSGQTLVESTPSGTGQTVLITTDGKAQFASAVGAGGQAPVGNFGVPVIVAQVNRRLVTTAPFQTILSFASPGTGVYRFSAAVEINNAGSSTPTITITFPGFATTESARMLAGLSASSVVEFAGAIYGANFGAVSMAPIVVHMSAGTVTVQYASTGTPNDLVSVFVERLA